MELIKKAQSEVESFLNLEEKFSKNYESMFFEKNGLFKQENEFLCFETLKKIILFKFDLSEEQAESIAENAIRDLISLNSEKLKELTYLLD
jgi:DNA gyrase/topoisomerase IV subunit A